MSDNKKGGPQSTLRCSWIVEEMRRAREGQGGSGWGVLNVKPEARAAGAG